MVKGWANMKEEIIKWSFAFLLSTFAYFSPIVPIILTVTFLIFLNTFLIWWSSKKQDKVFDYKENISTLAAKMFIYQTIIVTLFLVEKNIWGEWVAGVKIAAGAIAIFEMISILENSGIIVGQPVFKFLINKLGSKSNK